MIWLKCRDVLEITVAIRVTVSHKLEIMDTCIYMQAKTDYNSFIVESILAQRVLCLISERGY